MKKTIIAVAVTSALAVTGQAHAVKVVGKTLEIYGKAHVSVDASDNDRNSPNDQSDVSLSSNSSRLGFKGQLPINDLTLLYKIEQEVKLDEGSGSLATRNAYIGIKGGFGTLLAGQHDTPFKDVAGKWDFFGDTVGDRRIIMGASATNGNKMNQRGKNSLLYIAKAGEALEFRGMYAFDAKDSASGAIDNNDNDMYSLGVKFQNNNFWVRAAYEDWENLDGKYGQVDGLRVAGQAKFGAVKVGAIWESMDSSDSPQFDRDAWGVNGAFKFNKTLALKAQYMMADDYDGVSDSGADVVTVGLFQKLDKRTKVYAAYTRTSNDDNAKFQGVDGGHGDEVKTDLGKEPSSFSVGLVFKF